MALDTYDNLVKSIIDWSTREDISELVPDFIALAENEFYNRDRPLEVRGSETTFQTTLSGRTLALPADYLSERDFKITIDNTGSSVRYRTPDALTVNAGTGQPIFFTITDQIEFNVVPDSGYSVTLIYYASVPPLTVSNQTNYILTNYPNIYLYGALKQAFTWAQEADEAAKYDLLFDRAISGANKQNKKGRFANAPSMTLKGLTP